MKKKNAFTLAEVLITLTILGVVAAIMVPTLQKQNYKKTQVSRMAKAYSVLEKAAQNIAEKTGCIGKDLKCTGLLDITDETEFRKKFVELGGFRVSTSTKDLDKEYYIFVHALSYEKTGVEEHIGNRYFMTTPDRMAYIPFIEKNFGTDATKPYDTSKAIKIYVVTDRVKIYEDRDGKKVLKNSGRTDAIMGRDVFQFVIYGNFIVEPSVTPNTTWPLSQVGRGNFKNKVLYEHCDPNNYVQGDSSRDSCTGRIIRDGWKMNY